MRLAWWLDVKPLTFLIDTRQHFLLQRTGLTAGEQPFWKEPFHHGNHQAGGDTSRKNGTTSASLSGPCGGKRPKVCTSSAQALASLHVASLSACGRRQPTRVIGPHHSNRVVL